MKNFLVLFSCLTILGCSEKNQLVPIDDPPVVVVQPKMIELKISPEGEVPYGDTIRVSWVSENAEYCLINGKMAKSNNVFEVPLFKDTLFSLKAVRGSLVSVEMKKNIKVGDWKTSVYGIFTHEKWYEISVKIYQGTEITTLIRDDVQKNIVYVFGSDGWMTGVTSGGESTLRTEWSFRKNRTQILLGSQLNDITVSLEELILQKPITYNGGPAISEVIFKRQPVK